MSEGEGFCVFVLLVWLEGSYSSIYEHYGESQLIECTSLPL